MSESFLSELRPAMAAAGIVRIANVTGLDNIGIPVAVVVRPNSRSLSVSQGKGITLLAAKLSGVMESLEQFHAEHVENPLKLASYTELAARSSVVDVGRLPKSSLAAASFDEYKRILWAQARSFPGGALTYVPYEMIHLDLRLPLPEGHGFFAAGSNGLASGRTPAEALGHAIWELVERDALALFYACSPREQADRRVRLASIVDVCCKALLLRFEQADVGVAVWDITSDVGIATFMCSVVERRFDPLRRIGTARGFGCHPDRAVALRRALTEAAQSRLTRIAGSRDDIREDDLDAIRSERSIEHQQDHLAQEAHAERRFQDTPSFRGDSTPQLIEYTLTALSVVNLRDVLSVDLSREGMPYSVVRAVVPGLEGAPDDPFYVPGARVRAGRE